MECTKCGTCVPWEMPRTLACWPSRPCESCVDDFNAKNDLWVTFRLIVKTENEGLKRVVNEMPPEMWRCIFSHLFGPSCLSPSLSVVETCATCTVPRGMRVSKNTFSFTEYGESDVTFLMPKNKEVYKRFLRGRESEDHVMSFMDYVEICNRTNDLASLEYNTITGQTACDIEFHHTDMANYYLTFVTGPDTFDITLVQNSQRWAYL